jgi:hypothetical protein
MYSAAEYTQKWPCKNVQTGFLSCVILIKIILPKCACKSQQPGKLFRTQTYRPHCRINDQTLSLVCIEEASWMILTQTGRCWSSGWNLAIIELGISLLHVRETDDAVTPFTSFVNVAFERVWMFVFSEVWKLCHSGNFQFNLCVCVCVCVCVFFSIPERETG